MDAQTEGQTEGWTEGWMDRHMQMEPHHAVMQATATISVVRWTLGEWLAGRQLADLCIDTSIDMCANMYTGMSVDMDISV